MCNLESKAVSESGAKAVMVSRLLTPENKERLMEWMRLAHVAESSIRKLYGSNSTPGDIFTLRTQGYPAVIFFEEGEEE